MENTTPIEPSEAVSRRICAMFSAIAPRYDFLNRLLSVGRDRIWRKRAVDTLSPKPGGIYLDVATGTGDLALEIIRRLDDAGKVVGVDFSTPMLKLARKKLNVGGYETQVEFKEGAAENLPVSDQSVDGVTAAFGVRNFADMEQGIREMGRVLRPGGKVVILEFSLPKNRLLKGLYGIYFNQILPRIGRFFSRHPGAYQYLPDSVEQFPIREAFVKILEKSGFEKITFFDMTLGIVTIYVGFKPVLEMDAR